MSAADQFGMDSADRADAAREILDRVKRESLETVRVVFADQHGLLRGKTVMAGELGAVLRNGMTVVSTLLSKDTSGKTVYSAFAPDGGLGVAEMAGAGNMVMVPDLATFRVIDWAGPTGWLLCDLRLRNGEAVPFCTRGLLRRAVQRAAGLGFTLQTGIELEFHVFRDAARPGGTETHVAGSGGLHGVEPLNQGYQLLSDDRFDELESLMTTFAERLRRLDLPLRTLEVEFGPSQFEVTLSPELGVDAADSVILLRSALKQLARRAGFQVTFMCRPQMPEVCSSGWHLHQSLLRQGADGLVNAFDSSDGSEMSEVGRRFLAGQLRHARAASVFAVPTVNGYKRFKPHSMAPDRVLWGTDNRAAMLRVIGSAGEGSTHVENRVGEPAANPYLYIGSQLVAGLNGIEHHWDPGPAADQPYETDAPRLPATLAEALDALAADSVFRQSLGEQFVDYYIGIKRHEVARFNAAVTDWEDTEYFNLF
jgi:glutamine synthetase